MSTCVDYDKVDTVILTYTVHVLFTHACENVRCQLNCVDSDKVYAVILTYTVQNCHEEVII